MASLVIECEVNSISSSLKEAIKRIALHYNQKGKIIHSVF